MNQVAWFLQEMKKYIQSSGFILVPRKQNKEYMASVGMSFDDLQDIICSLRAEDCFRGPEADDDPKRGKWTVAMFSPKYENKALYLKIGINYTDEQCKCISVKLYKEKREG